MKLFIPLFLFSILNAKGIDDNSLSGIYTEAILFVSIFGIMSVVSIVISKRNAKKFEVEHPLEERKATRREVKLKKELHEKPIITNNDKIDRLSELSQMFNSGIISQKEFDILKENLNIVAK